MCTLEIMAAVEPLTKEELNLHTDMADDCASVYVGTYHKYNCGSLEGAWVNLETFYDEEELMEFLHRLHADESDPEFMIQDYMNFPRRFYSESMNKDDFAKLFEWLNLDEEKREMCEEYWNEIGEDASVERIVESLVYSGNSDDYFDELADEELSMCNAPECLRNCFDYEKWRKNCAYDYNVTSNFVFSL